MTRVKVVIIFSIISIILGGCGDKSDKSTSQTTPETSITEEVADDKANDDEESDIKEANDDLSNQKKIIVSEQEKADEIPDETAAELTTAAQVAAESETDDGEISESAVLTAAAVLTKAAEENGIIITEAATNTDEQNKNSTTTPTPTVKADNNTVTMYATIGLNVRAEGNASSEILGELQTGEEVTVIEIKDNNWAKINFNGIAAYVYSSYLSSTKIATATPTPTRATSVTNKNTTNSEQATSTSTPTPKLVATNTPTPKTSSGSSNSNTSISKVSIISKTHDIHTYSSELDTNGLTYYSDNEDVIKAHFDAVNSLRTSEGLSKLTLDATLCRVAAYRTAELVRLNYFGHYHPGYEASNDSACAFDVIYFFQDGYRYIAENIANQSGDWQYYYDRGRLGQVFCDQFAESPNHYANMTNSNYTKIGICFYIDDDYVLVTQIFG